MRNKTLPVLLSVLAVIASLLVLPIFINSSEMLQQICSVPKAQAQDNTCLPQESTLAVIKLQTTLDGINYQSTITALESGKASYQATITALEGQLASSQVSSAIPTSVPAVGLPFEENFSTNLRGWNLTPNNSGTARLSRGTLAIEIKGKSFYWQPIPSLEVGDDFYIEATINPDGWWSNRLAGFALGNEELNQYHIFALGCPNHCDPYVGFYDNQSPIFMTRYDFSQINRDGVRVGLEGNGGLYTLYIDGQPSESAQISPYGHQIGLAVVGGNGKPAPVYFDDIVVRESR